MIFTTRLQKNIRKPAFLCLAAFLINSTAAYAKWGGGPPKLPPTPVNVVKAKQVAWHQTIRGIGTLIANQSVMLKPGVSGHITAIHFKAGQSVPKGKLLVVLDHKLLAAQLAEAKAQLELTQLAYRRAKRLIRTKSISDSELDQAKANFHVARAKVDQIKASLDKKFIMAPFRGRLGLRHVNLGDYIASEDTLVSLQAINPIYVDFNLSETQRAQLKKGQPLTVKTPAYPDKVFKGKILAFDAQIDEQTRNLKVRGIISNPKHLLAPGGFADVSVRSKHIQHFIAVPQEAILNNQNESYVYKVVNGRAVKTTIIIAKRTQGDVLLNSGVKLNDVVIVEGQLKLKDGAPVNPKFTR